MTTARIELTCPLSQEELTAENFNDAVLVIVGNTVYPVIGASWQNKFNTLTECPITRRKDTIYALNTCYASEELREALQSWLLTGRDMEAAPESTRALVAFLTGDQRPEILQGTLQYFTVNQFASTSSLATSSSFHQPATCDIARQPFITVTPGMLDF